MNIASENDSFTMLEAPRAVARRRTDMITIRLSPELHLRLKAAAASQDQALNTWCLNALKLYLDASQQSGKETET